MKDTAHNNLNADHRAFSKSTTTLLTDGTDGRQYVDDLHQNLNKNEKHADMSVTEFDVCLCIHIISLQYCID